jgi:hypothetical protein
MLKEKISINKIKKGDKLPPIVKEDIYKLLSAKATTIDM